MATDGSNITINFSADDSLGIPTSCTLQDLQEAGFWKAGDFEYALADGTDKDSANAGTYTIKLTKQGLQDIQAYIDNQISTEYDKDGNPISNTEIVTTADQAGTATFEIKAVANTVTVTGTQTETYDASAKSVNYNAAGNNSVKVTVSGDGQTADLSNVDLNSSDFQIVDANGNPTTATEATTDGTTPCDYRIVLTAAGIAKIQQKVGSNFNISQGTGYGKLVINKAVGKVTLTGNGTVAYNGRGVNGITFPRGDYSISWDNAPGVSDAQKNQFKVIRGIVNFYDQEGNRLPTPIDSGTYTVKLNSASAFYRNLQNLNPNNITWNEDSLNSTATLTITPAKVTASLGGSGSKTYNGSAVTPDELTANGSTISISLGDAGNISKLSNFDYQLKDGDYTWNTADGKAPTDHGTYTITLTEQGLKNIQAVIDSYTGGQAADGNTIHNTVLTSTPDNSGSATFEITPLAITNVQVSGNDQSKTYDGTKASFHPATAKDYGFNNTEGLTIPNTLNSSDFDWYADAQGTTKIDAPTNAGTYYLLLNKNGKQKWAAANPNYSFTKEDGTSTITGAITYTIKKRDLVIELTGQASKVYDGKQAVITAQDLTDGKFKINWNNGNEPADMGSYTLTAGDLEVVDVNGNAVKQANASGNTAVGNPVYTVRLTAAALNKIQQLTGAANYQISQNDTKATYLIYAQKAQLTLSGNQTTTYGNPLVFDPKAYKLDFSNWVDTATDKPTQQEIGLQAGDLYIKYGSNNGSATDVLPTDVGKYQVVMTQQLLTRLKKQYPDYDFDAVAGTTSNFFLKLLKSSNSNQVDASHEPATYVIEPAVTNVTINGTQTVKYGESTAIDTGNYSLTITATVNGVANTPIFAGQVTLTDADLAFVISPTNVGDYQVKLSAAGLEKLAKLSVSSQTGESNYESNYDWTQAKDATAGFEVIQMPTTITVNDAKKSVVYGSADWLNAIKNEPRGYTLTVKTEDGKALNYTVQDGDLVYSQTPGNVGDYQVELSDAGLQHIKAALGTNYACPQTAAGVTTKGTFTVKQGQATVKLTGSDGRTYDGKSTSASDLDLNKYSYTATIYNATGQAQTIKLTADDLEIVPNNDSTANVGTYKVQLSNAGQEKLKALDGNNGANYTWKFDTDAQYNITAAAASVELSGQNSKVYDGQAVTIDEVNSNSGNITVTFTYPGSNANSTYTLTAADLDWYDDQGHQLDSAPTEVGTYTIKVKDSSLANLKARLSELVGSNAVLANNLTNIPGTATFTITPKAISGVTVAGDSQSKTYDGQPASLDISGLTVKSGSTTLNKGELSAADFDWYDAEGTKLTEVPTNAGKYQARLNAAAYQKLQTANPNYSITAATGTINYEIKQAPAKAVMGGSGTRAYNGKSTSVTDVLGSVTWTSNGLVSGQSLSTNGITADDYEWFTKNDTAMTGEPTNAGTYYLKFKSSGISKLQSANPNYSFATDAVSGEFTYTITPAAENIAATLSGSNHKTYDGHAVTNDEVISTSGDIKVTFTYPGSTDQSTYALQAGDYTWSTADGSAPTNAGTYTLTLTKNSDRRISRRWQCDDR